MPTQAQRTTLSLGVNYDWWARRLQDAPPLSDSLIEELAQAGFRHIRLPLNPMWIGFDFDTFQTGDCDRKDSILRRFLNDRLQTLKSKKMGLVLTIDASDDRDIFARISVDYTGARLEAALECLASVAESIDQNFAHDHIIIGNFNEPRLAPDLWNDIQSKGLARVARRHTKLFFLATAAFPTNIDALLKDKPINAVNIGYEFHFYEPFPFTHQGIASQGAWLADKSSVSLPALRSDREELSSCNAVKHEFGEQQTCVTCLSTSNDKFCSEYIRSHASEFGTAYLQQRFQKVSDWAEGNYFYIGEFGVNKGRTPGSGADSEARLKWFKVVSDAARRFGFGRSVFELACGMGVSRSTVCSAESLQSLKTIDLDPAIVNVLQ